jgi:hypothetical protein
MGPLSRIRDLRPRPEAPAWLRDYDPRNDDPQPIYWVRQPGRPWAHYMLWPGQTEADLAAILPPGSEYRLAAVPPADEEG